MNMTTAAPASVISSSSKRTILRRINRRKYSQQTIMKLLMAMLFFVFCFYVAVMIGYGLQARSLRPFRPPPRNIQTVLQDHLQSRKSNNNNNNNNNQKTTSEDTLTIDMSDTTLRAFVEPIQPSDWDVLPLPRRTTTAHDLTQVDFPQLTTCSELTEQWPVDNYPDDDPFLPWIHDVFPTHDGTKLQFVAQNRRRCHTGTKEADIQFLQQNAPQVALFQGVSVKRISGGLFQLTGHEHADEDGMDTRFLCRFKPSNQITLSRHNINYDYAAFRKGHHHTFSREGRDLKSIHTSQLVFYCPIPDNLQQLVASGDSVKNDKASLFVDLVPIRTPPRYNATNSYLPPRYKEFEEKDPSIRFDPATAWGDNHILPQIADSGRWENVPICKPSQQTYENTPKQVVTHPQSKPKDPTKKHRLVACIWASSGYATRGERFSILDGQRRLREWIHFNRLVGFDHFYIYDNSVAHSNQTLQTVTDDYPEFTTRIVWPSKVCNNNKNFHNSPGERSSQYAAESSCRLRFGPHVEWIGQFDIDEYLVPLGALNTVPQILDKLDDEGKKIISFGSWRSWPRRTLIVPPVRIDDPNICDESRACFNLQVPTNRTFLQTYNCDRFKGKKQRTMPAEKQLYRPDYVLQHFVHYSTATIMSMYNQEETKAAGYKWKIHISVDPLSRFSDETTEGTMLHTKAIATQDTSGWLETCTSTSKRGSCRIGNPWPKGYDEFNSNATLDETGWKYNCYVNEKIDDYYVPLLEKSMMDKLGKIS